MTREERLEHLLLQWEELAAAGKEASPEELCRDCPDLANELRRRIHGLKELEWLDGLTTPSKTSPAARSHAGTPANGILGVGSEPVPGYRLVRRIGKGGFGEVFEATAPDGSRVALKVVPWTDKAASVEWRALEAVRGLRHPNLLTVLGSWQSDEQLVIATELADRTLLDRWREARENGLPGIPREELLSYFRQAAEAIDYLHQQGVQHRDVKPANLLLVGETLKVGDFGLARVLAHSVTGHTGSLTLAYAAPEFFEGITTRQSDQYCLAATWCQLRGGRLPFEGTPAQMVAGHLNRQPDLAMLPEDERPAVARALAKSPQARWPTCRAFVEALASGARGRAVPRSRPLGPRLKRWGLGVLAVSLVAVAATVLPSLLKHPSGDTRTATSVPPHFDPAEVNGLVRSLAVGRVRGTLNRSIALTNGGREPTVWDIETGLVLRRLGTPGGACAALAPFESALALTGGDDGSAILWNLETGQEVRRFVGHEDSVTSVAFSHDGKQVLSASCDSTVRLWERESGQEVRRCLGHQGIVTSVAFGPTGREAVSGGWDGRVILWDLDTGKQKKVLEGHTSQVKCVAFAKDGRQALSGGDDSTVRLWDLASGKELRQFKGHKGDVWHVEFLGSDRILSAGGKTARLWDAATGQELDCSPEQPSGADAAAVVDLGGEHYVLIGTERDGLRWWPFPKGG